MMREIWRNGVSRVFLCRGGVHNPHPNFNLLMLKWYIHKGFHNKCEQWIYPPPYRNSCVRPLAEERMHAGYTWVTYRVVNNDRVTELFSFAIWQLRMVRNVRNVHNNRHSARHLKPRRMPIIVVVAYNQSCQICAKTHDLGYSIIINNSGGLHQAYSTNYIETRNCLCWKQYTHIQSVYKNTFWAPTAMILGIFSTFVHYH